MPEIREPAAGRLTLANNAVEVTVRTDVGPRIISFKAHDRANLMVDLPDASLEWRDGRRFHLRGGHRLWIAPEVRTLTYTPDDEPCDVAEGESGVAVATRPSASSPFRKELYISLAEEGPAVSVRHRLVYEGDSQATAAPWAITMLPPDGTVLLPFQPGAEGQLQADRNIVLWPYTSIDDPGLELSEDAIVVAGGRTTPIKVGTSGVAGWGAYVRDREVFIKRIATDPSVMYPDKGAGLQCYANASFCELETLGPLRQMAPGDAAEHIETWELRELDGETPTMTEMVARLVASLRA